ncbi:hypothetical protein H1W37_11840 [Stappia taiwanensis]|uniref:Peptidase propeptide and YPEB domain-containing protein n=1 Tax=Stappia taiwanensis TaxID=992267 RepID=A0A838XUP9_9HYPH|nr:hypothetical protein [Stappia taiwanensis]MBA4612348.1 hypothetical protein [Stappia taiwanensis]GGF04694.1 hypothetical protein GCM10007285_35640 [Stappia taiwanensis]
MMKALLTAATFSLLVAAPSAQALDIRAKAPAPVAAEATVQLAGWRGRGWHRGYRLERLRPRQIARRLNRKGYYGIRRIRPRGDVYVVRARGWRGKPVRLVVDAYSGRVLDRSRARRRW